VLIVNILAPVNGQITGENMAFNPLSKSENEIFYFQLAWQNALTQEQFTQFKDTIDRRINIAFQMSKIEKAEIEYVENAFSSQGK
jgi:hypothetical protein